MPSYEQIKQAVSTKAQQLGFSHMGIAPALPVPYLESFLNWISAGYHAEMGYLARPDTLAKRADPELILPDCQRVICLAMPYHPPTTSLSQTPSGHGRIAAYARSRDYHLVIQQKLQALAAFIQATAYEAIQLKAYVDTGPVLERTFAVQAGLGMLGKHSNLIIPGCGSYVFLAVLLTDLALPSDPPFTRDLCGSCQRCIDACPTGCILPDRTIDARRCISYLTIENKGILPDSLKSQIGDWVFGCDICQLACPHNSGLSRDSSPLGPAYLPEAIDLVTVLTWDQDDFNATYQDSALSRAKLTGILRNAAVVLGNQREAQALPILKNRLAQESDPAVQDALRWAINQFEAQPPSKQK